MNDAPVVSVIVVSWNVCALLDKCIEAIAGCDIGASCEIIVVDNRSTDGTIELLQEKHPHVKLIRNRENVGFARANNQGFKIAAGRYVLVLNPDTIVDRFAISRMLGVFSEFPSVGIVGPRLVLPSGETQHTCARRLPSLSSALLCEVLRLHNAPVVGRGLRRVCMNPYDFDVSQPVEAVSGAAMLLPRHIIDDTGGFREEYLHGGEDVDLCFRIQRAGWKVYYASDAKVVHFSGQSNVQARVRTAVDFLLSQQRYFALCFSRRRGLAFRLMVQWLGIPNLIVVGLVKIVFGLETRSAFRDRMACVQGLRKWRPLER